MLCNESEDRGGGTKSCGGIYKSYATEVEHVDSTNRRCQSQSVRLIIPIISVRYLI